jgi:large subunit ribosomal protein L31
MKKGIHPKYNDDAKITCSCGNVIKTGSTVKEMEIEICGACHPFYTGKKKLIDSTGRVDRFQRRLERSAKLKESKKKTTAKSKKVNKKTSKKVSAKKTKVSKKKTTKK